MARPLRFGCPGGTYHIKADSGDPYYFRIVADYIHLNPARAGLAGGSHGKLGTYKWSSIKAHGEQEAMRLLEAGSRDLGLLADPAALKKSDGRKVLLAMAIRERTGVENGWISQRLAMGSPTSVSRLVSAGRKDTNRLEEMIRLLQRMGEVRAS